MTAMPQAPKTRRRWFQFSLRAMLVLISLLTIPLGWVAIERRQSKYERHTADKIRASGVFVQMSGKFDLNESTQPWWRAVLSSLFGDRVQVVTLNEGSSFTDLTMLSGLTSLKGLVLENSEISDLSPVAGLAQLELLGLSNTQVRDLSPVANMTCLTHLFVQDTSIRDLSPLSALKNLESLSVYGTQVVDLSPLAGLSKLGWLDIGGTQVVDLSPLAGLSNLRQLDLNYIQVSEVQIERLKQALPNCDVK
jgi:hypothetical protein